MNQFRSSYLGENDIAAVVQTAARYELADFVSREPSLEETFLAEYGKGTVGASRS